MKLQKMLYFLYRDYLKETGEPLFTERFMAWKYGPVLDSVYHAFKAYGSHGIKQYAGYPGTSYYIKEDSNQPLQYLLTKIWESCKPFNGIGLSKLTHREGSAWLKAYRKAETFLDDKDILADSILIE